MARSNTELELITETLAEDVLDHLLYGLKDLRLVSDEVECSESYRMIVMKLMLQHYSALCQVAGPRAALHQLRQTFKEIEINALTV